MSARSSVGGRSARRDVPPSTDTWPRARATSPAAPRARPRRADPPPAGQRQRARLGRVAGEHAGVADRQHLRGRQRDREQHGQRGEQLDGRLAALAGARSRRSLRAPQSATAEVAAHRRHGRAPGVEQERAAGFARGSLARQARHGQAPLQRSRQRAAGRSAGLAPTSSARAAARAAFAQSHSVWPVRTSCHATAAASSTSGTTATVSTEPGRPGQPGRGRQTRIPSGREHAPTVPPGGRTGQRARGYESATRSGGSASRPRRGRRTPAPAARTRPARRRRPELNRRSVAGEGQDRDRQRAVEREPDVRVERLDVEPVLAVHARDQERYRREERDRERGEHDVEHVAAAGQHHEHQRDERDEAELPGRLHDGRQRRIRT